MARLGSRHCRRWHPVVKWHSEGTAYTLQMLYFDCRGKRYYAGQEDLESRHETKAACVGEAVSEGTRLISGQE